jgi:hypothetical protein
MTLESLIRDRRQCLAPDADSGTLEAMADDTEKNERLAIPLEPTEALRALLKVDPDSEPPTAQDAEPGDAPRYKRPKPA